MRKSMYHAAFQILFSYDSVSDNVPQVRTLSEKINFSLEINVSDNWNILGLLSQVLEDM